MEIYLDIFKPNKDILMWNLSLQAKVVTTGNIINVYNKYFIYILMRNCSNIPVFITWVWNSTVLCLKIIVFGQSMGSDSVFHSAVFYSFWWSWLCVSLVSLGTSHDRLTFVFVISFISSFFDRFIELVDQGSVIGVIYIY